MVAYSPLEVDLYAHRSQRRVSPTDVAFCRDPGKNGAIADWKKMAGPATVIEGIISENKSMASTTLVLSSDKAPFICAALSAPLEARMSPAKPTLSTVRITLCVLLWLLTSARILN